MFKNKYFFSFERQVLQVEGELEVSHPLVQTRKCQRWLRLNWSGAGSQKLLLGLHDGCGHPWTWAVLHCFCRLWEESWIVSGTTGNEPVPVWDSGILGQRNRCCVTGSAPEMWLRYMLRSAHLIRGSWWHTVLWKIHFWSTASYILIETNNWWLCFKILIEAVLK